MSDSERRALEADRLLSEPLLLQTLARMEAALIDMMIDSGADDDDRRNLAIEIRVIRELPDEIRRHITEAEIEVAAETRQTGGFV